MVLAGVTAAFATLSFEISPLLLVRPLRSATDSAPSMMLEAPVTASPARRPKSADANLSEAAALILLRSSSRPTSGALAIAAAVLGDGEAVIDRLVAGWAATVRVVDLVLTGTSHDHLAFVRGR